MIKTYLQRRLEEVDILLESLAKSSVDEFNRIGHQISGNARNFGFPELEEIAFKMENLTLKDLSEKGPALLNTYRIWLENKRSSF